MATWNCSRKIFRATAPAATRPIGFPRAGASAALPVADAEFGLVSVIGVGGAEFRGHFAVSFRAGVLILHPHGNGRAERFALERAGKNLHPVAFLARRDDGRLAGPAAVQVRLNIRLCQAQARRAAVNDHAHAAAVGFAPGGDAKKLSE